MSDDDPIDVPPPLKSALALRDPGVPVDLSQLSARGSEDALGIIDARAGVIRSVRRFALLETYPSDYTAFRRPDGVVTCYLDDDGCARVRDLFGISIFNVSRPERVAGTDGSFMYFVTGDGRCSLTHQVIEAIEGGRSSSEKFCDGKSGAELERVVRKAARANLNGTITRELAGLESIPIDELARVWTGTPKSIDAIAKGRGFGTSAERLGGNPERGAPDVPPPNCGVCGAPGRWINGPRGAFYGCPDLNKHRDRKWTQDAEQWVAKMKAQTPTPAKPEPEPMPGATEPPNGPPPVGDIKW
jgi:hypothetical protein